MTPINQSQKPWIGQQPVTIWNVWDKFWKYGWTVLVFTLGFFLHEWAKHWLRSLGLLPESSTDVKIKEIHPVVIRLESFFDRSFPDFHPKKDDHKHLHWLQRLESVVDEFIKWSKENPLTNLPPVITETSNPSTDTQPIIKKTGELLDLIDGLVTTLHRIQAQHEHLVSEAASSAGQENQVTGQQPISTSPPPPPPPPPPPQILTPLPPIPTTPPRNP
ncbi:hypothetical protein NUU61_007569 [Penicillium alfredii]|uniref:Uncharacterized protein n=1 Tax=Penicillium alfredii TaxID=1506179 RepID=A0A9W9EQR3_9EURO|nr:uncharacterized protein NUU61_007569 [Penicillium alfredii]KAJ5086262.1 hypothetical protein NUU61_007569 [Penicillium alfredii]